MFKEKELWFYSHCYKSLKICITFFLIWIPNDNIQSILGCSLTQNRCNNYFVTWLKFSAVYKLFTILSCLKVDISPELLNTVVYNLWNTCAKYELLFYWKFSSVSNNFKLPPFNVLPIMIIIFQVIFVLVLCLSLGHQNSCYFVRIICSWT